MVSVNSKPRGRPQIYKVELVRGNFRIPTDAVQAIKQAGDGNLTRGIMRLVKMWEDNRK